MIKISRHFTKLNQTIDDVFDSVEWSKRSAILRDIDGTEVFRQDNVEFPTWWSDNAVTIVASKYFWGQKDTAEREYSLKQLINRVVSRIAQEGVKRNYFNSSEDAGYVIDEDPNSYFNIFKAELAYMVMHQMFAWNSPVWFNIGTTNPQAVSACYITQVDDNLQSIAENAVNEMMIFKDGSGNGFNASRMRGSNEHITGGGHSSGPISFMQVYDKVAFATKSGGRCLPGYQKVYTAEEGPISVEELAKRSYFLAISFDPPSNRYKIKKAFAWKQNIQKDIIRITTDKGYFDLSSDHSVKMSHDGSAIKAIDLKVGQSLFSGTINSCDGYIRVNLKNGKNGKEKIHRMIAMDILNKDIKDKHVHHKDHNKQNNKIENLEVLTAAEHTYLHALEEVNNGTCVFQNVKFDTSGSKNGMHSSSRFWNDEEKVKAYKEKQRNIIIGSDQAANMQSIAVKSKMINTGQKILNLGGSFNTLDEYLDQRRALIGKIASRRKVENAFVENFGSFENYLEKLKASNHRILSIDHLGKMDVYSVEVECSTEDDKSPNSGHNFLIWPIDNEQQIGSGITVFNSRRAAKMVIMNVDHPDIEEFIRCKSLEELKMKALIAAGYDKSPGGEAAMTVAFQNANHSVRITGKFLDAVKNNEDWHLINRTDGKIAKTLKARDLWNLIAQEAWETGDPGIQFDDLIQEWHTCKADGPIEATNPCAEYVFLNNTSCNLASFNLLKFLKDDFSFDIDGFTYGISLATISMNILIDFADFPVEKIAEGTRKYRTIGIGYANLGGLLMSMGIPYDSDEGRNLAASITSLMTAQTYQTSADVAEFRGPFERFKANKVHMYRIIAMHYDHAISLLNNEISATAADLWTDVLHDTDSFANAQATVLAPTGTIGLMMECDTTGVEPELSLVKYKKLVDGGNIKYVNDCVRSALKALGYAQSSIEVVINTIRDEGRLHEVIIPEHRNVFACSFEGVIDCPVLSPQSHVKMLGAVAPFLSGSASKTCNLPETATVQDIQDIYNLAHSLGVKCIAVYRDNCKQSQPLTTKDPNAKKEEVKQVVVESVKRKKLPNDRDAKTHKFEIAGHEGYITVGLYPDGSLGEVFIRMNKGGSFANGMMDSYAIAMSLGLQHGVPIETFINKFKHVSFEPFGWTDNPQIRVCKSPVDYLARYLELKFCNTAEKVEIENDLHFATAVVEKQQPKIVNVANIDHGSACSYCGHIKIRIGKCERCLNCGEGGECGA